MKAIKTEVLSSASEIWERVNPHLEEIEEIIGDGVLVAIWQKPERTAGGVFLTDRTRDEDVFQGKSGLVLKMGHLAFKEDEDHVWGERVPRVGDWVAYRVGDAWPLYLGEQPCRIVRDVHVRMILRRPDVVY